MARIAGINIPPHKHAEIGLTAIYGIGRSTAQKICDASGVPYDRKIKDLSDADLEKIREEIGRFAAGCRSAASARRRTRVPARARASPARSSRSESGIGASAGPARVKD
jgi:ribosomal protein S13